MTRFDTLYKTFFQRVNEDMPVDLYPGIEPNAGERVIAAFPEKSNYILTPAQVTATVNDVIDYLQTRNNHSPLPYKDFQEQVIAKKIVVNSGLNKTKAKYAARVVHNAMIDSNIITDERSGTKINNIPQPEEVEVIADDIVDEVNTQIAKAPEQSEPESKESEKYFKSKDFPASTADTEGEEDSELETAWNKLPDNEDISWTELRKVIGMTTATKLIDIGALIPTEDTENNEEEEDVPEIEFDEFDEPDLSDDAVSRHIEPNYSERRSPYRDSLE